MESSGVPAGVDEELLDEVSRLRHLVAEFPPLDVAQTARLLGEVGDQNLDEDPRRQLVQHHLWMVLEETLAKAEAVASTGDLFQEGTTALLKLVHGLAPRTDLEPQEFVAQVREVVTVAIGAALEEERSARERDAQWARDSEQLFIQEAALTAEAGAPPGDGELARHLGWSQEKVRQLRRAVAEASSQHDLELLETLGEMEEE